MPSELQLLVLDRVGNCGAVVCRSVCRKWRDAIPISVPRRGADLSRRAERICVGACRRGWLSVLRWARENGAPWDSGRRSRRIRNLGVRNPMVAAPFDACGHAATGGSIETLEWAVCNGALWSTKTCKRAARAGDLALLRWCRGKGAPWDEGVCFEACVRGDLEMVEWAVSHGAPHDDYIWAVCAERGHSKLLEWAASRGIAFGAVVCERAAKQGRRNLVRWLVSVVETPVDEWTIARVVANGDSELLDWLIENVEGCVDLGARMSPYLVEKMHGMLAHDALGRDMLGADDTSGVSGPSPLIRNE